jgi:hypothetical protein
MKTGRRDADMGCVDCWYGGPVFELAARARHVIVCRALFAIVPEWLEQLSELDTPPMSSCSRQRRAVTVRDGWPKTYVWQPNRHSCRSVACLAL